MVNICQPAPVPCFKSLSPLPTPCRSETNSYKLHCILGFGTDGYLAS